MSELRSCSMVTAEDNVTYEDCLYFAGKNGSCEYEEGFKGYLCTRPSGHTGAHAAGAFDRVVAVLEVDE